MSARMTIRRIAVTGLAMLGAVGGWLALAAGSASASLGYPSTAPSAVFGAPGSGDGQFSSPTGVAVEDSSGDVYVVDSGNDRVQRFDAEGKYLGQFDGSETPAGSFSGPANVAVDNSPGPRKGDVYVTDVGHGVIDAFDSTGKYLSQIVGAPASFAGELFGVAVDGSGNVWAYDSGGNVDEFSDTGSLLQQFNTSRGTLRGFTVDANGDVYLLFGCNCVGKYSPTGTQLAEWGSGTALAVNQATHQVFLDTSSAVEEFGAFGEPYGSVVEVFGAGAIAASDGIAVNSTTSTVYASQSAADTVAIFKTPLDVTTGAAGNLQRTGAKLEGVVNPEGKEVTSCQFEYGATATYGQTIACAPGSGSSPVPLSAELSGLTAGTTYHYRLLAGDAGGSHPGGDRTFTTLSAVSELQTEGASNVEQHGLGGAADVATLNGSLAPDGLDTHYYFEYGETEAYGSLSPALPGGDAGEASKLEHLQVQLAGLKGATAYHFRLVASNSFGVTVGLDMKFTTPAAVFAVPAIGELLASSVSQFAATLNGTLQTGEALVDYHFEYGTSAAYGSVAPIPDAYAPITAAAVAVSAPVEELQAGTTYHYRIVASSPGGTEVKGPDETFTTLAVPVPSVETGGASGVGVGVATLSGTVDPHGWDSSYAFQYGTSTAYGSSWPTVLVDMGALQGPQPVLVSIPNLLPGTTYHYRLVASNGGGTVYGADMTFTTSEYPAQIIQEPAALRTLLVPSGKVAAPSGGKSKKKSKTSKKEKKGKAHHPVKRARGRGRKARGQKR
jgi:hypothetical protein